MPATIGKIKSKVRKIRPNKVYTTQEITRMGVVLNSRGEASAFTLYRLINSGQIPAKNLSIGKVPRYVVQGRDLRAYLFKRYGDI